MNKVEGKTALSVEKTQLEIHFEVQGRGSGRDYCGLNLQRHQQLDF